MIGLGDGWGCGGFSGIVPKRCPTDRGAGESGGKRVSKWRHVVHHIFECASCPALKSLRKMGITVR